MSRKRMAQGMYARMLADPSNVQGGSEGALNHGLGRMPAKLLCRFWARTDRPRGKDELPGRATRGPWVFAMERTRQRSVTAPVSSLACGAPRPGSHAFVEIPKLGRQQRRAILAAFAGADDDSARSKINVLDTHGHRFRNPHACSVK
jgi:hypothetical protein